jgi:hypothetical protein
VDDAPKQGQCAQVAAQDHDRVARPAVVDRVGVTVGGQRAIASHAHDAVRDQVAVDAEQEDHARLDRGRRRDDERHVAARDRR